ncbi:FixH family protein [Paenibacillus sp. sgz302251]|uniref:FixH family protein n=1 Tax=Paenibacillus sp. sgz302251 TaxID=3414493 RepID=UPI003C7C1ED3
MLPSRKPISPLYKLAIAFIVTGFMLTFILTRLHSDMEAAPPLTEHTFEHGQLIWSIDAYPAKVLTNNTFTINITDDSGAPIRDVTLAIKLDMLSMVCGDVSFQLTETAPGQYTGMGVPLMAGTWKATLVLDAGDQSYSIERHFQAVR